jgi:WD40 repeat protein
MGNIPPEQAKQIEEHILKQQQLVDQLKNVVQQQARALAAMAEHDEDYDEAKEVHRDGYDSGNEEFDKLTEVATSAEQRRSAEGGDEERNFMAVKPWLGAMKAPSNYVPDASLDALPNIKLELEHVYGYRARLCRNNAYWVDEKRIVYFAAGVGIVHNIANNTQQFFMGHTDDIICLAFHRERKIVVTGQQGKDPSIRVWDVETCRELACLVGQHKRAVVAVDISPDGNKVVSVGADDNHSVAVYDWKNNQLVGMSTGDTNKILDVMWNLTKTADCNNDFVTVGVKHIQFWNVAGGSLKTKKGLLGTVGEYQAFLTVGFTDEYALVATESGHVYPFKDNKLKTPIAAHNCMIYGLRGIGDKIFTCGKDGCLSVWDWNFKKIKSFDMNKQDTTDGINSVRAVDQLGDNLLVGTITSTLYNVKLSSGETKMLTCGHFGDLKDANTYGELWGLAPHPNKKTFCTVGEDRTLRLWDTATRKQTLRVEIKEAALCCAFHPTGNLVGVGFRNGNLGVYDAATGMQLYFSPCRQPSSTNVRVKRVQSVKYSPDGKFLAVGGGDFAIDIYDDKLQFVGSCKGMHSNILHIDWSADSKFLQCVTQDYELLFYNNQAKHITDVPQMADVKFQTQECILGFTVQGIWPKFSDGSDINAVNKSVSGKYLASAEDTGMVKVFNYPCIGSGLDSKGSLSRRPEYTKGLGHSSHVTNVNWLCDDSYIISTGGADLATFQFRVVRS